MQFFLLRAINWSFSQFGHQDAHGPLCPELSTFKFAKYARRQLAEFQYRFNRRADLAAVAPRVAVAVAQTRPCPERVVLGMAEVRT
jgi:hypothetical protein